ncbi:MAG: efflux RND transporter permease subunit [Firmicutes bacterium]|jgi:HAE1 family hydrophobic/amphiphilic exporter-1|nr:efflux RND transporter permease subunit [Bacillota bacterium]
MNLASVSIRRPVTVMVAVAAILLFGYLSLDRLGLDLLPELNFPMTAVVTVYPQADPETVEATVSVQVERALRSVRNIRNVTSMSMENVSLAIAEFNWGTDLGAAQEEIRANLDRMQFLLPEGAQTPIVSRLDPSQIPVLMMTVGAPGEIGDVTREAREVVKPALERIEGVAGVSISGGAERVITVEYDHSALVENGLSPTLLQQLVAYQNMSIPAGVVVDDGVRYQAKVGAKFTSADDIANLALGLKKRTESQTGSSGLFGLSFLMPSFLTVGDIARVDEIDQKAEGFTRINGKPAVVLLVFKQSGENTVTVANRVKAAIAGLRQDYPHIELSYAFDQSKFITKAISDIGNNAAIGAFLAVAVLYLFLRHLRSTLIVATAIPLSIVFTFVLMYAGNQTLNLMSLGGLALGVGMLVDNSIVVLESIFRRQEMGDSPRDAALNGTREVGMAITASTLTTVAVFIPVVFIKSFAGHVFRDLAVTVSFSLLASLAVSLTVVPLLSSWLIRVSADHIQRIRGDAGRGGFLLGLYDRMLRWSLDRRNLILGLVGATVVAAVAAYPFLTLEFLPSMDMGRLDITLSLPSGTPVEVTNEVSEALEAELVKMAGVESVTAQVGSAGSGDFLAVTSGTTANSAKLTVSLAQEGRHALSTIAAGERVRAIIRALRDRYPDLEAQVDTSGLGGLTSGTGVSDFFGTSVTLEVSGQDPRMLVQIARGITEKLRTIPGLIEVGSSVQDLQPVMLLDVNRTRALMGGLTVGQIGLGVRSGVLGTTVTHIERQGELIPVIVKPASGAVPTLDALLDMPVTSSMGIGSSPSTGASGGSPALLAPPTEVLVGKVVSPKVVDGPITISRRNGRRYVTVRAAYQGMKLSEAGTIVLDAARSVGLPRGYEISLAGVNRLMKDSFSDLRLAGWIAVVLVYMVMAIQYESLFYPLIIMFTLPLALIGATGILLVSGTSISVTAIIGLIVLAGIVVNNGIVMVDFINQLKSQGMRTRQAVIEAGRARLRPILMTALTTILGLIPIAIGRGQGSELEMPLALTVIGGLATATFLTLFVIPVIYELMDGIAARVSRKEVRAE